MVSKGSRGSEGRFIPAHSDCEESRFGLHPAGILMRSTAANTDIDGNSGQVALQAPIAGLQIHAAAAAVGPSPG